MIVIGDTSAQLSQAGATHVLDSVTDLPALVAALN